MLDINIRGLDIIEAFNMFMTEWDPDDDETNIGDKVIKGIRIRFSLFDYVKGRRNITEKSKSGKIVINNKMYKLEDFDMEIAMREKIMKRFLMEKLDSKPIVQSRIPKHENV